MSDGFWMDVDAALSEVPVNILALIDDTDFKSREESVVFNQAGLDLLWNFTTTAGVFTQTAVTPTDTAGDYDWVNQGNGYYSIEIPASGGASINNDTEGFGFFSGFATGILPWRGPVIGFRAAALNNALIDGGDQLDVNVLQIAGDATAADNLEIVFATDFATNYNTTRNAWTTNYTDIIGTVPIVTYGLDHLVFTSVADEVADNSIIAKMVDAGSTADWSNFVSSEDSLRSISEKVSSIGSASGGGFNFAPVASNAISVSINNGGAAVDKSTSPATVGIPVTGHAFLTGHEVTISNTVAYNGTFQIDSVSTNEVVIVSSFTGETFGADDLIKGSIKGTTIEGVETTNTFSAVSGQDGVYHVIDDDGADNFTIAYRFEVGSGRLATEAVFEGFQNSGNDNALIQAYDFVGSAWETRKQFDGQNGSENKAVTVKLLARNTGTDATDIGNVFIRITDGASSSNPTLNTDSLLVEAQGIGETAGYQRGRLWFDSIGGTDAAVKNFNGAFDKPVKTELNIEALIAAGLASDIQVLNGSTYTLASSAANYSIFGDNWTLVLNGQNCASAHFEGAFISGVHTGTKMGVHGGETGSITLVDEDHFDDVGLSGTITLPVGSVEFFNCHHDGDNSPILDFGAAVGSTTVHCHSYHGAIEVQNMGDSGTDIMHLDGDGTLVVNANGSGGTINLSGNWRVTNNGSATINFDDDTSNIVLIIADTADMQPKLGSPAGTDMSADIADIPTVAEFNARTLAAASYFDPAADTVANVTTVATLTGHTAQTGDSFARLGAPAGASVSADIAAIKADSTIPTKNQAFNNIPVLMVDSTDHVTPKTGRTVSVTRSLNGGAYGAATGSIAEVANGTYQFDASAADMNADTIMFRFAATDADDAFLSFFTRP